MDSKKLQKLIEAINAYYAFALLVYAAVLYLANNSYLFFWIFILSTPILTGWTGYLIKSYLQQRNQRYGFKMLSDVISYEIKSNNRYILRCSTKIRADASHLIVYPVGYKWTGDGEETPPIITGKGQQLLGLVERYTSKNDVAKITSYKETVSAEGDWHYWFVALTPPVYKGDIVDIEYSQEFYDKRNVAVPRLSHFVRTPMKRLELNVKFQANDLPKSVTCSFIKPSDPRRAHPSNGVNYDPQKQWATWVIENPKRGYCYRIQWQ